MTVLHQNCQRLLARAPRRSTADRTSTVFTAGVPGAGKGHVVRSFLPRLLSRWAEHMRGLLAVF